MRIADQLNISRRGRSIPTFLKKTYEILQDSQNNDAVRWADNGIGFLVVDQQRFSTFVLPMYFKHSNYSSFVRQLNMYNFHKIREGGSENYFIHEMFDRKDKGLISEIKRKPERKRRKLEEGESLSNDEKQIHGNVDEKENLKPRNPTFHMCEMNGIEKNTRKCQFEKDFQLDLNTVNQSSNGRSQHRGPGKRTLKPSMNNNFEPYEQRDFLQNRQVFWQKHTSPAIQKQPPQQNTRDIFRSQQQQRDGQISGYNQNSNNEVSNCSQNVFSIVAEDDDGISIRGGMPVQTRQLICTKEMICPNGGNFGFSGVISNRSLNLE